MTALCAAFLLRPVTKYGLAGAAPLLRALAQETRRFASRKSGTVLAQYPMKTAHNRPHLTAGLDPVYTVAQCC